jgi:hypothetical protein
MAIGPASDGALGFAEILPIAMLLSRSHSGHSLPDFVEMDGASWVGFWFALPASLEVTAGLDILRELLQKRSIPACRSISAFS